MNKEQAKELITSLFESEFQERKFTIFLRNLLKSYEVKELKIPIEEFPSGLQRYLSLFKVLGTYKDPKGRNLVLLVVYLNKETTLLKARTSLRDVVTKYLSAQNGDAALVAFVSPSEEDWRFSYIMVEPQEKVTEKGRLEIVDIPSPARKYSYLVGKHEVSYTAKTRFIPLLISEDYPTIETLLDAFSVEKVTEEFYKAYEYAISNVIIKNLKSKIPTTFEKRHSFAQQLLSRIMFLYFVQKKGWLKWERDEADKKYLVNLWKKYKNSDFPQDTFYSIWLSSLFFGAFNGKDYLIDSRLPDDVRKSFREFMPFLNGGLFSKNELDEIGFEVPDSIFEWLFEPDPYEEDKNKGFLEIFNFTIDESLPLDVDVAVDPEMLGNVYQSLIAKEERGRSGIFYTPRTEIDFMCRLSLTEYLAEETQLPSEEIVPIIFSPQSIGEIDDVDFLKRVKNLLDNVRVVDPAVGSASFLVGMMNVLVELHQELSRRIYGKDEDLFTLKEKIIRDNLYGVDVKDWAVMIGELRLWLSLTIDVDEKRIDVYSRPLLPNLSFKIRQGDSLLEEVGGIHILLRNEFKNLALGKLKEKVKELRERKRDFFKTKSSDLSKKREIEKLERELLIDIIDRKIRDIEIEKEKIELTLSHKQLEIYGNSLDQQILNEKVLRDKRKQLDKLADEIKNLQKLIDSLKSDGLPEKKDYFLWEIEFAEIFAEKGGFDIVIGNPPYVRQERIAPPLENQSVYSDDQWRKIKKQYKEKLIRAVKNIWGDNIKIDKKSDLYVYFYYQGLSLLHPGGIFCFINSSSWLDVGYGAGLQEFLLKRMTPVFVIDNIKKRSFKQADVNTVIVLIKRPIQKPDNFTLRFVAFKKPFEDVLNPEIIERIMKTEKPVFSDSDFRLYPKTRNELLEEGVKKPKEDQLVKNNVEYLPYIGNKWGGKYLRAPEIYFKILEKGKDKLVKLGEIAEIRRGFTTGANEFFYLKPIGMTVRDVMEISEKNSQALIRVQNAAGWEGEIEVEFLKPVVKSPRELKSIVVRLEDLNYLVFMCHKSKSELKGTKALEYIKWGESKGYYKRPTCKGRERWWDLGKRGGADILVSAKIGERYVVYINPSKILEDKILYRVTIQQSLNILNVCLLLNSTISRLSMELMSRQLTGAQAIADVDVNIWRRVLLLSPEGVNINIHEILNRPIYSIFTELGLDPYRPIRKQEPHPLPDRKALDDIVFDTLGLTEDERKEVYWAVAELVKQRLEKARSV